eukprot:comp17147_c0_seq1/m.15957 comp17147_c0_seq1/g.15957  ORF comp17147_c0_seq1/g.15957 comp17147_c0_seq1/m.15957 type:complete len:266 (-) comp17147_c0_seq1:330-1127(-)
MEELGWDDIEWALKGVVVAVNLFCLLVFSVHIAQAKRPALQKRSDEVLLVTSHPDDECMFFAPTVLGLQQDFKVSVLCLSQGEYDGQGKVREKELTASCNVLGIPPDRVRVVGGSRFPDNPTNVWPAEDVAAVLLPAINERNIGAVITFDEGGVSGHANHRALYHGLKLLVDKQQLPAGVAALCLESTGLLRKYIAYLDAPLSALTPYVVFSSPAQVLQAQRAMKQHASQLVWFRRLYVWWSRYMYMNTLRVLADGTVSANVQKD